MRDIPLAHLLGCLIAATYTAAAADPSLHPVKDTSRPPVARARTDSPHVPPWSVGTPAPRNPTTVTPGGTFSRPASTFSSQTGSFSRPSSTFAHPSAAYRPLSPIQVPPSGGLHPPGRHHGHRVIVHPHTVIIHQPVVYEPQYVPVEVAADQEAAAVVAPAETKPAAAVANPVVIDLPPGAVIRRPASAVEPAKPAEAK